LDLEQILPAAIVVAIMLLVGLPVHEFSHALAAYRLGDGTAKLFGRLTLNPIAHFGRSAAPSSRSRSSACAAQAGALFGSGGRPR
jgi:hypothetical protein